MLDCFAAVLVYVWGRDVQNRSLEGAHAYVSCRTISRFHREVALGFVFDIETVFTFVRGTSIARLPGVLFSICNLGWYQSVQRNGLAD